MNDFTAQVSTLVSNTILAPLVAFLKEKKNVEVTIDELQGALNLPAGATHANTIPPFPGTFTGLQAVATGRSARGKKVSPDCPKCEYVLTRGDNPGTLCGKAGETTPLGPRCKQHMGKKGGKTERTGKESPHESSSGLPEPQPQAPKEQELSVTRIPGTEFYREISTGAVLKPLASGGVAAVGIEEGGNIRPLTESEAATLSARGIVIQPLTTPTKSPVPNLGELPTL